MSSPVDFIPKRPLETRSVFKKNTGSCGPNTVLAPYLFHRRSVALGLNPVKKEPGKSWIIRIYRIIIEIQLLTLLAMTTYVEGRAGRGHF